ncbi:hypothetical protein QF015_002439 [Paenarthrobacter sp. TE4293]
MATVTSPAVVPPVIGNPSRPTPVSVPTAPIAPVESTVPSSQATIPPAVVAETPVTPVVPSTPRLSPDYGNGTLTFPDGHISFTVPAGWSVQVQQAPYNQFADNPGGEENSLAANIFNETGEEVAHITSGGTGGLVGGPVNRTILDSQELSAFDSRDGASHFAFVRDEYPSPEFPVRYYLGVVANYFMTEGPDSTSVNSFMAMPNGAATAAAVIDESMTAETAEAWMKPDQYVKLRALCEAGQGPESSGLLCPAEQELAAPAREAHGWRAGGCDARVLPPHPQRRRSDRSSYRS